MAIPMPDRKSATVELGVPVRNRFLDWDDEFLTHLRGTRGIRVYREMSTNDATCVAILRAVEMQLRSVDWMVEPASDDAADVDAADFLESNVNDLEDSWPDFISAVTSFLPFGWSAFEVVYKIRDGSDGSPFDDGRLGWRKFGFRGQETLYEWKPAETGAGWDLIQLADRGERIVIPAAKLLHFRTTTARGTPVGQSILRGAYRSWYFKKRVEEALMIGIERDLNGVPIAKIPAESLLARDAFFEEAKALVTRIRRDEQQGVVWPLEYNEDGGKPMFEFDILRGDAGASIEPTRQVLLMLAADMAGTVLADFLQLGRSTIGSRALAEPKQELFQQALQGWLDMIAATINRQAVRSLLRFNGINPAVMPKLVPEPVKDTALQDLGDFLQKSAQAGMDWGFADDDDPIADRVRMLAGFDARPEVGRAQ